jgi:hypothetical protein
MTGSNGGTVIEHTCDVGQVWRYRTRPNEGGSTLIIVKKECYPRIQEVFHIQVRDVRLVNQRGDCVCENLSHVPVGPETLRRSLLQLVRGNEELPDISEGYAIWREAFDNGKAGVYSISIAEILDIVEDTME